MIFEQLLLYLLLLKIFYLLLLIRLPKIKEWIDAHDPGSIIIPFSGALEIKLMEMTPEERDSYLKEQQTTRYRLSSILRVAYTIAFLVVASCVLCNINKSDQNWIKN